MHKIILSKLKRQGNNQTPYRLESLSIQNRDKRNIINKTKNKKGYDFLGNMCVFQYELDKGYN